MTTPTTRPEPVTHEEAEALAAALETPVADLNARRLLAYISQQRAASEVMRMAEELFDASWGLGKGRSGAAFSGSIYCQPLRLAARDYPSAVAEAHAMMTKEKEPPHD